MGAPMRYQPQGLARISQGSGLARGLVSFALPPLRRDVVRNVTLAQQSGGGISATPQGVGWRGASSNCAVDIGVSGGLSALVGTSEHVSFFCRICVTTLGARQIFLGDDSSGGINESIDLEITSSNQWRLHTVNTSPSGIDVTGGTVTLGWHDIEVEITAGSYTASLIVDGQSIGSTSSGNPRRAGSDLRLMQPGLFSGVAFQGQMVFAAVWNRPRTSAERAQLRANPWQLFEAADDWDDVLASGSGLSGIVTESATATDSCGAMLVSAVAVAEALAVMEAQISAAAAARGVTEATAASDAAGANAAMAVSRSESAAAIEAAAASVSSVAAGITESTSLADTAGAQQQAAVSAVESVSSTDTPSAAASMPSAQAEAGAAADSTNPAGATVSAAMVEAASAADAVAAGALMVAAVADVVAANDSVAALMATVASQGETAGAVDLLSAILQGAVTFARAPTGSGYKPQRVETQSRPTFAQQERPSFVAQARPSAIQRNRR